MTEEVTTYLCIGCPLGCRLEVTEEAHEIVEVRGFACKKGDTYARQEHVEPQRIVTSTVAIRGGLWARLPVRTSTTIPKLLIGAVMGEIGKVDIEAPVSLGETIIKDVLGTGADIVATRDMPATETSLPVYV